jgi:hypothetical protein
MEIDAWISGYKVRAFPWIDKKRIYVNVQYYAPGQSIRQPPVWDKTVFVTDDPNGNRHVHEFTHSLVEHVARMRCAEGTETTITVESCPKF